MINDKAVFRRESDGKIQVITRQDLREIKQYACTQFREEGKHET